MSAVSPARSANDRRRRTSARVFGTVQGVGFRPHAFRLAEELDVGGWIRNDERGVIVEVEGSSAAVDEYLVRLAAEAPPMARVEAVRARPAPVLGESRFRIVESSRAGAPEAQVSPDAATCPECLAEVLDPAARRYRYPFTNCTDCGPRFSIVRGVPYDRAQTTMADFEMCPACREEYSDPRDRRFHAQPIACPACGPRVRLADSAGRTIAGDDGDRDAVETAARMLRGGSILAVKGLGGYHLACRADDASAVAALRSRKHREDKPFALMAADLGDARRLVELSEREAALLEGPEHPIVIARRRKDAAVAAAVAPRSRDLGVMLPYTPLHHLLLADAGGTLVMTSGNVSDEPIAYRDDDAFRRLAGIADAFLAHDRPVHVRSDDSVLRSLHRAAGTAPLMIRRSRGFAPGRIALPFACERPVLGCGAELKSTFCLAKGRNAWVGQHIGDLRNWETLSSYREGVAHFERLFAVAPALAAHDLHPDYLATRYALERADVKRVEVQHHHAHFAACLAEHGELGGAVGAIFDGAGVGTDGTVWGGEILAGDVASCDRAGWLAPVRLPGGDAAVREPWRMACAWLAEAFGDPAPDLPEQFRSEVTATEWEAVCGLLAGGVAAPVTTSAGRLFDAVAALCGIRARVSHEGQAAAELEGLADPGERAAYPLPVVEGEGHSSLLDVRETVRAVARDVARGAGPGLIGARFHNALAAGTTEACTREAERHGVTTVVLSGGVFQNRLLLERTASALGRRHLRVLVPERLPPNDGGISYGQVAVAAARDRSSR